ncbi:2-aminoethanethiol dioxygenase-like [Gouania willdenowi]|uniref:2-aminoethanethiol dioxygenase-like n=1 Tax=Gouania willdenowi TaxID=441366 RepID=A0A8C5H1G6_GOUWI|nr:2-aminoethanethiol dioxygenase-like [Gouania willdenowi]
MASVVQRLARQARLTFTFPPRVGEEPGRFFLENLAELRRMMFEVQAADLRLVPVPQRAESCSVPVSYMHICETEQFSMGVFLLRPGASIPLHDHPDMHGLLRVLYGTVRLSCLDRPVPVQYAVRGPPLLRSVLRSSALYTEHSGPCVLHPDRDNLHRVEVVDGPSAFLDILAPPYDPDQGRDCHYYRVLGGPEPAVSGTEVWVTEVPQPEEFRCGGEQYQGPPVRL